MKKIMIRLGLPRYLESFSNNITPSGFSVNFDWFSIIILPVRGLLGRLKSNPILKG